jgi:TldD protein
MPVSSFSPYLEARRAELKKTIAALDRDFGFASALAADTRGFGVRATAREVSVSDSRWSERGFTFRVQRAGRVAEWALDDFESCETAYPLLKKGFEALLDSYGPEARSYPPLADEALVGSWRGSCGRDPFTADMQDIIAPLREIAERTLARSSEIVHVQAIAQFHEKAKLYLSADRELDQSFFYAEASVSAVAARGEVQRDYYQGRSGLSGLEILGELEAAAANAADECVALLDAVPLEAGVYDVICGPDIAGLIAHEAFGHGVETDMFDKGRAKAVEYLGKRVGSPLVTMYDGAAGVDQTGSYWFDDEGTVSSKTKIIDRGILVSGISDKLSALALGIPATGNGRRQDFGHKAYARMTNTYFAPGGDRLEDMIASVERGYLLEQYSSGMEDPKNWGIQLIIISGKEIREGKLTGKRVAPVVCSGYVPDLLSSISMVSGDFELSGTGYCGKGHKELVKVSCGGPYLKARMRLA